ncbi:uncharacterized protein BP5553_03304 [Venustampulla echinocandica]|uniref:Uncharacterized protein n=1 Tax=Venustampulla echinocandica TaxID=2656787 RepID=A0A370TTX8_9HELO|nr:uncharacterized protein BP5553_03304 [Venustampulla echinocandica]RDL38964.1 hypothetical protein BP5553_03304 [Venustampulla echinocandica]
MAPGSYSNHAWAPLISHHSLPLTNLNLLTWRNSRSGNTPICDPGPLSSTKKSGYNEYQDQGLCACILKGVTAKLPLQILASTISRTSLFAAKDMAAGEEILVSEPLANCVEDEMPGFVYDYYFTDSRKRVHPSGHFRKAEDQMSNVKLYGGCRTSQWKAVTMLQPHEKGHLASENRDLIMGASLGAMDNTKLKMRSWFKSELATRKGSALGGLSRVQIVEEAKSTLVKCITDIFLRANASGEVDTGTLEPTLTAS